MQYQATISHSSIARARVIDCGDNLAQAKRRASAEFGAEQLDYRIVIIDERGETVAARRVGDQAWTNAAAAINVGDRVEAGHGDDHDTGRVESIDGESAIVAWYSGVKTPADIDSLTLIG